MEDKTKKLLDKLTSCQHCGGEVEKDKKNSTKDWLVWRCKDCGSNSPVSVDIMVSRGRGT